MPVSKCGNGKWRIGDGPCVYTSEEAAERAYAAYRAQKYGDKIGPRALEPKPPKLGGKPSKPKPRRK